MVTGRMQLISGAMLLLTAAAMASAQECSPTPPDVLGPFYVPDAPVRSKVGSGYVLSGAVRSSRGCAPVVNARVELWMAGPDAEYADRYRATLFSDRSGAYRFESHVPPAYYGRPPHIHIRVSAPGFRTLVTQHYPVAGAKSAQFDLVLTPDAGR